MVREQHGLAGRHFAEMFTTYLARDREGLRRYVLAERNLYLDQPTFPSQYRDVTLVHGRCATIFAVACLAIKYKVVPYSRAEIGEALRKCERDHVAFIDDELRRFNVAKGLAPSSTLLMLLEKYLKTAKLIDLRHCPAPRGLNLQNAAGYIGVYRGRVEYWIPNAVFEQLVGGKEQADALKAQLHQSGRIHTERRGSGVVKRPIGGVRTYVVALTYPF